MCGNRGTIWANTGYGYQIVQCPECNGKSHKEFDVAAMRAKLQNKIAEKKEKHIHAFADDQVQRKGSMI